MPTIKKFFLLVLMLELLLSYTPAFAQTPVSPPTYSGPESQIQTYLCAPPDSGTVPSDLLFTCINKIYKFAIVVAAVIGVFFIVIAGYMYMSAEGNSESVDKAKDILRTTVTAIVILFAGYVLLKALNPDLVVLQSITPPVGNLPSASVTTAGLPPGITPLPPGGGTPSTGACTQTFPVASPATGCTVGTDCTDVKSLTQHSDPTDCQTADGACLVSQSAKSSLQTFISTFNSIAQGTNCQVQIASAIQLHGVSASSPTPPSVSPCHKPTGSFSGTCVDMHVIPYTGTCQQDFYQAAQQSGVVSLMVDEYCQAVPSTTGGNIHINFCTNCSS